MRLLSHLLRLLLHLLNVFLRSFQITPISLNLIATNQNRQHSTLPSPALTSITMYTKKNIPKPHCYSRAPASIALSPPSASAIDRPCDVRSPSLCLPDLQPTRKTTQYQLYLTQLPLLRTEAGGGPKERSSYHPYRDPTRSLRRVRSLCAGRNDGRRRRGCERHGGPEPGGRRVG